ncbi:MAG: hypothetical protein HY678_06615 [Chloroflexi bacterium]|nr:hypothetical protein [Chloroflexota bacterium]
MRAARGATADVEKRARAAGKTAGTDNVGPTALDLLTEKARELIVSRDRVRYSGSRS